jgi:hypothetical protein
MQTDGRTGRRDITAILRRDTGPNLARVTTHHSKTERKILKIQYIFLILTYNRKWVEDGTDRQSRNVGFEPPYAV